MFAERSQGEVPRNMRPAVTAGSVPLMTPQGYTHWTGVKYMQANACPCRATIFSVGVVAHRIIVATRFLRGAVLHQGS